MKRVFWTIIAALAVGTAATAADTDYTNLYNRLVARVGFDGIGVETLLDKWEKDDSSSINLKIARFSFYRERSRKDTTVTKKGAKYLGQAPVLTLKDSTGRDVNYFEETLYDETLFGKAISSIDKAIALDNTRLDLQDYKINALIDYEKESPDLALQSIKELIAINFGRQMKWSYPGETVDAEFFSELVQSWCYRFYRTGTPQSYDSFMDVSNCMLKHDKRNTDFINNLGTYWLVCKSNDKKALKYYRQTLKINPSDEAALRNIGIIEKKAAAEKAGKSGRK